MARCAQPHTSPRCHVDMVDLLLEAALYAQLGADDLRECLRLRRNARGLALYGPLLRKHGNLLGGGSLQGAVGKPDRIQMG